MTRLHAGLALLAAAAGALALAFTWQPGLGSLFDDSVSYLVMAQALSPWHATPSAIAAAFPAEKYPPLFPLMIAVGGGAYDWRIAHAWVAASFGAAVFLLGLHARDVTRSDAVGFAAALVFAWMPGAWLNVKGILSEFPYVALVLAALLQYRAVRSRPTMARHAALAALLAAVVLTRTIGIALLAAVAIAEFVRWFRSRDRAPFARSAATLCVAIAAIGAWYVLRPRSGEDAYLAFGTGMARGSIEHGAAWTLTLVGSNISALTDAWLTAFLIYWGEPWKPAFLLACFVGASGAAATLWRSLQGEADAIYVLVFAAILIVWPFPGQMYRLALPAMPLLVVNAFWLWKRLAENKVGEPRAARWSALAAAIPLTLCVPAVLFYIVERARLPGEAMAAGYRVADIAEFYRIPLRPAAEAVALQQIGVFADLDQVRRTTPESARVMWYLPDYVALLAGREGVPLDRTASRAAMAAQLAARRPDYVYLSSVHPRDTAHREGDPMDALAFAREFADVVWHRDNASGATESALLKVDPARVLRQ